MPNEPHLNHINRPMTDAERLLAEQIRAGAKRDFPPKDVPEKLPPPGLPSQVHAARTQRGLTRYELSQTANVPATVIRAIEQGDDVPLSQFHAVVAALGLCIELVEQTVP